MCSVCVEQISELNLVLNIFERRPTKDLSAVVCILVSCNSIYFQISSAFSASRTAGTRFYFAIKIVLRRIK